MHTVYQRIAIPACAFAAAIGLSLVPSSVSKEKVKAAPGEEDQKALQELKTLRLEQAALEADFKRSSIMETSDLIALHQTTCHADLMRLERKLSSFNMQYEVKEIPYLKIRIDVLRADFKKLQDSSEQNHPGQQADINTLQKQLTSWQLLVRSTRNFKRDVQGFSDYTDLLAEQARAQRLFCVVFKKNPSGIPPEVQFIHRGQIQWWNYTAECLNTSIASLQVQMKGPPSPEVLTLESERLRSFIHALESDEARPVYKIPSSLEHAIAK